MLTKEKLNNKADEIWKSAIKLRGKFKAYEYQDVVLPVIMLRRIECVLLDMREKTKAQLLPAYKEFQIKDTKYFYFFCNNILKEKNIIDQQIEKLKLCRKALFMSV